MAASEILALPHMNLPTFLLQAKQRWWQVLPLSPTGYGNSPYAALSAFAGNPLLVSLEKLAEWGWIDVKRIAGLPGRSGNIHFDEVEKAKMPLLVEAARNFLHRHNEAKLAAQWVTIRRVLQNECHVAERLCAI